MKYYSYIVYIVLVISSKTGIHVHRSEFKCMFVKNVYESKWPRSVARDITTGLLSTQDRHAYYSSTVLSYY